MRPSIDSEKDQQLAVGKIFQGRFLVEAVLGEGGMGTVFAAQDLNLARAVAIKVIHERSAVDEPLARFLREAKVTARLSSEHVVRVYELGHDPRGLPYIVMERVSGRGLDTLVQDRGPVPIAQALEYALQVCSALSEAHAYGIVHRDIKPGNVLLDEQGPVPRVKVVDFGVAKARPQDQDRSGLTAISTLLGTPEYMAPEQLYAAREADARADLWGLGATLYFMLAGEAPFSGATLQELLDKIQHGPTPSVSARRAEVPPALEGIVCRCLHRDPQGRFRSADDLAQALRDVMRDPDKLPSLFRDSGSLDDATEVMDTAASPLPRLDSSPSLPDVTQVLTPSSVVPASLPPFEGAPSATSRLSSTPAAPLLGHAPIPPAPEPASKVWPWALCLFVVGMVLGSLGALVLAR